MTLVKIHGILAREYGSSFKFSLPNPKNVLEAIDCNRSGFIKRLVELQKQGFCYDIIINKKRVTQEEHISGVRSPETIDLVPAIAGSGPAFFLPLVGGSALLANIASALFFAVISYALTPKPEVEALEIEADASKASLIFSNTVNVASQGSPVPIGYGRLKVGSQVIQATIKSFPQHQTPQKALGGSRDNPVFVGNRADPT
jgi:predicted phage tail protein|tara:strand:+ start:11419 stop:12021 length:603 start_codon:yes stop_codon:yes gene_type:complete